MQLCVGGGWVGSASVAEPKNLCFLPPPAHTPTQGLPHSSPQVKQLHMVLSLFL